MTWLGDLPTGWQVAPLKHVATFRAGGTPESSNDRYWAHDGEGVPWIAIGDMSGRDRVSSTAKSLTPEGCAAGRLRPSSPGTILLAMYASVGEVATTAISAVWNQAILGITPRTGRSARFLAYVLRSANEELRSQTRASTQANLNAEQVGNLRVPQPPVQWQVRIAEFLDYETGEIDAFIADQERLIDLLTERRRSTISSLLGSAAPSGDSVLMKYTGAIVLGKMLQTTSRDGDAMRPYLRAASVQPDGVLDLDNVKHMPFSRSEASRLDLRRDDVVVVEGGVGGYGRAAVLHEDLDGWGFQNSIVRIRPADGYDGRFLAYALLELRASGYITTVASATSMPHFTAEKVAVTPIPYATYQEQRRAADQLDSAVAEVDAAIADAREAIALSKERRAALISAAVTGKIDVRDWKPPEHKAS